MEENNSSENQSGNFQIPLDFLKGLDLDAIDFLKEAKYVGALTGSVVGGFISTQLSWSLALRLVSVVGGSYTGAFLAGIAYQILEEIAAEKE